MSEPTCDPLLKAIYDSWKADGHQVTLETGVDGRQYIRIHSPGEWRPFHHARKQEQSGG